jgi:hypothetical protein
MAIPPPMSTVVSDDELAVLRWGQSGEKPPLQ